MTSKLSVVSEVDGSGGLHLIDLDEIIYLEYVGGGSPPRIIVHRPHDEFYIWGPLKVWTKILKESGYNFYLLDRNIVIHLRNIKRLDEKKKLAYFEYDFTIESKACTIAMEKYKPAKDLLHELNVPFIEVTSNDTKESILGKIKAATTFAL